MRRYWILFCIGLAGLGLRLYHLTSLSLWHDEAFSALLIRYSWTEMMQRIVLDVHPPFYYIILRFWSVAFGGSLGPLRGFSLVFAIASIFILYKLVKDAFESRQAAVYAALLFAINPFQIQFVSQGRMYTLGIFLCLLSAYCLVKALESREVKKKAALYAGFALAGAASMLTHYYLIFTVGGIALYGLLNNYYLYRSQLKKYSFLIASYVLIGLGFLPWLPSFLTHLKRVGGGYWIPAMDRWSVPQTFWQMLTGINLNIDLTASKVWVLVATIFTLFFLYQFVKRTGSRYKWLIVFSLLAPFAGALLFVVLAKLKGSETSVYLIRYFVFAGVFYSTALAIWLSKIKNYRLRTALLVLYTAVCLYGIWNYWHKIDVNTKPGMAGAAGYLSNILPSDKIYVASSSQFFSFTYYNRTATQPLLYTPGINSFEELPHFYGTALLTDRDIVNVLPEQPEGTETAWLIWTDGFYGSKPQVPANWKELSERKFGEINFYTPPYTIYVTKYKID